jgi:hypothetical protein
MLFKLFSSLFFLIFLIFIYIYILFGYLKKIINKQFKTQRLTIHLKIVLHLYYINWFFKKKKKYSSKHINKILGRKSLTDPTQSTTTPLQKN